MEKLQYNDLLEAGVHFGHLKRKWNPKMAPYIFMERKGIHIIDLYRTLEQLEEVAAAMKQIAYTGKKILFVATKKQAKSIVKESALKVNMPFVTERWYGGMLTNFATIRKSIRKMESYEKMEKDGTFENITKKERLRINREKEKLETILGGISGLNRLPAAVFIVDIVEEHIALAEAKKLNITTFGVVDTNADPSHVDFSIPANDDSTKSIALITEYLTTAIQEGLEMRKKDREKEREAAAKEKEAQAEKKEKEAAEKKSAEKEESKEATKKEAKGTQENPEKKATKNSAKKSDEPKAEKKEEEGKEKSASKKKSEVERAEK